VSVSFNYSTKFPQNLQSTSIINISRSPGIPCVRYLSEAPSPPFTALFLPPLGVLAYRTQHCNRTRFWWSMSGKC